MAEPERTADGRHIVVDGRRWRATDPAIPEDFRVQMVRELMAARRAVGQQTRRAKDASVRARVRHTADDTADDTADATADATADGTAEAAARARVQDAKVALGERGHPWWEEPDDQQFGDRAAAAIRALLRARSADSSVCPSDIARAIGGADWRDRMDDVRQVAQSLAATGIVRLTQGEEDVGDDDVVKGPIRIRRGTAFPHPPG